MNEEQIQKFIDNMEEELVRGCTKEEARRSLQQIGILDENGEVYPDRYDLVWAMHNYSNRYQ